MSSPECAICLEDITKKDLKILICNHKFHTKCIDMWTLKNPICPYCRTFLKSFFETQINYIIFNRRCNIFFGDDTSKITLVYNLPYSLKVIKTEDILTNEIKSTQLKKNFIYIIYRKGTKMKTIKFKFKINESNIFIEKIQSLFVKNYQNYINNSYNISDNDTISIDLET
jgi:hypothetical protein